MLTHQFLVSLPQELTQFKAFGAVEGLQVVVSVRHWQANVPRHSGMLFRGFVYKVRILLIHMAIIPAAEAMSSVVKGLT